MPAEDLHFLLDRPALRWQEHDEFTVCSSSGSAVASASTGRPRASVPLVPAAPTDRDGAPLTLERRLVAGEAVAAGELWTYRRVAAGPGELRTVLRTPWAGDAAAGGRRSLVHLAQVSDLQLADVQSPGRLEFLELLRGRPNTESFVPAQRPQEALHARAYDAILRTVGEVRSPETGTPVDLVVSTGDNLDNAQWNELEWFVALMAGGRLEQAGGRSYEGVQAREWPGGLAWRPDGGGDRWRTDYGYPTLPGLLERALASFEAPGLSIPWVSCFGNHDGLRFGMSLATEEYEARTLSSRKAYDLPPSFDPFAHEEDLADRPELFLAGATLEVTADPSRRVIGRREFVEAHLKAAGLPHGHGYSQANLDSGTTYFSLDVAPVARLIVLDTANLDGFHQGSIGARQLAWLEAELARCHARGGGEDRLVVLASHHNLHTLTNLRQSEGGLEDDHPRLGGQALMEVLAGSPNVVCWLNGHTHTNEIRLHDRSGPSGEAVAPLVEITTCSIADWPSQARLVEIVANEGNHTLSVLTTMLDHASPLVPGDLDDPVSLPSLHRELAANVPGGGFGSGLEGWSTDRNTEVVLPLPFRLP